MKKIKLLLPIMVLISILSFSFLTKPSVNASTVVSIEGKTDAEKVEMSLNNISIRSTAIASFPVTYKSGLGATITWESSNEAAIDVSKIEETNGWAIVNRSETETVTVTLTVKVTLNEASKQKSQEVTIPAGKTTTATYNVSYDFGTLEGVTNENPVEHTAGKYVALNKAGKEGYTFIGWYSDKNYTKEMKSLPVGMYKDITVYGKLEKNKTQLEVPTVNASYEYTYDGLAHSVVVTADDHIEVTYENNSLTDAGEVEVTVSFAIKEEFKDAYVLVGETTKTTTLRVNPRAITVKADDFTSVYGDAIKELTYTVTAGEIVTTDTLKFNVTKEDGTSAGSYKLTVSAADTYSNYAITYEEGAYTIAKKDLTVTPSTVTISRGAALPTTVSVTFEGFVEGENESDLTGVLVVTWGVENTDTAGTYEFEISGYTSNNYKITFIKGTLIISETTVKVEISESALKTTYNGTIQKISPDAITFKDNGTLVTITNYTVKYKLAGTEVENPTDAGTYEVLVSFSHTTYGTGSNTFTYTIEKKAATITITEQTTTYGEEFTLGNLYTVDGLINDDGLGTITVKLKDVTEAVNAGTYTLTAEYEGNANYEVTVNDANLIINKADAIITVTDLTVVYDGKEHSIEATLNHTETTELTYEGNSATNVKRDESGNVVAYTVTISAAETANYKEVTEYAKITITPKAANLKVNAQYAVYTGNEPEVNQTKFEVTGVLEGEDLGVTLTKEAGTKADAYIITATTSNTNYDVTIDDSDAFFTITKASLTLVIDDKTITKGDELPEFTYTLSGFVNSETKTVLTKEDVLLYAVDSSDNELTDTNTVGKYTITGMYEITADNYELITITNGTLTIELTDMEKVQSDVEEIKNTYGSILTGTINNIPALKLTGTNGSTITWTSTSDIVNIDPTTGEVTIINVDGNPVEIVLTAEVKLNEDLAYSETFTFMYEFVVKGATIDSPYSVEEAIAIIKTLGSGDFSPEKYYVKGVVKSIDGNAIVIETENTNADESTLTIYKSTLNEGVKTPTIGMTIIAYGYLQNYKGTTPELAGDGTHDFPIIVSPIFTAQDKLELDVASINLPTELYANDTFPVMLKNGSTVVYTSRNLDALSIAADGTVTIVQATTDVVVDVEYTVSLEGATPYTATAKITVKATGTESTKVKYTLNYETNFETYASEWKTSYSSRTITATDLGLTDCDIETVMSNAAKQTGTITNMPVMVSKSTNQYVTITSSKSISSITFTLGEWSNKKKFVTITIEYTTDGTNWIATGVGITDGTASSVSAYSPLTASKLPEGVTGVRLVIKSSTNSNTQVGIASAEVEIK